MIGLEAAQRRAFSRWIRTGWLPTVVEDGIERKFNPYHDSEDGRFTFAPGGPRSLERVVIVDRKPSHYTPSVAAARGGQGRPGQFSQADVAAGSRARTDPAAPQAPVRSDVESAPVELALLSRIPRSGRGSNIRAFEDPMTLEQAVPGLARTPAGVILPIADNVLDIFGPAQSAKSQILDNHARGLVAQIETIDPKWRDMTLGTLTTVEGRIGRLNGLRFDRAAALLRVRNDPRALQVETLRFVQAATDRAYERGLKRLKAGRLPIRLSNEEALGNYIDREVRRDLRERLNTAGIDSAGPGPVRVNRRENDSTGSEMTFRRPDARVGAIAYDVTLTAKTLKTQQVRGFFCDGLQTDPRHHRPTASARFEQQLHHHPAGGEAMSEKYIYRSSYTSLEPYVPGSLSEIYDMLASLVGGAPTFVDDSGTFPERDIDSEFMKLTAGFGKVRGKVGEDRYAALMDLAERAKALFADDPEDSNGKTDEGIKLLYEIEAIIQAVRSRRKREKLPDDEGEVSGD